MANKRALHDVPRQKQLKEGAHALWEESDRGCALVAGALVDEHLRDYLAAYFETDGIAKLVLDEQNAPAGTFSARIKLAFAIGVIGKEWYDGLEILRGIRNEAAHFETKRGRGFDTGFGNRAVRDRCLALLGSSAVARERFKDKPRLVFCWYASYSSESLAELAAAMRFIRVKEFPDSGSPAERLALVRRMGQRVADAMMRNDASLKTESKSKPGPTSAAK